MNIIWLKELFAATFSIIKEPIVQWGERKSVALKGKMEVEKLTAEAAVTKAMVMIEMIKAGQTAEIDWDARAQEDAKTSWKDEVLMLLLFSPVGMLFISAFLPQEIQDKIISGVNALEQFPTWYIILLVGIVASVYGLRWLVKPILSKLDKIK